MDADELNERIRTETRRVLQEEKQRKEHDKKILTLIRQHNKGKISTEEFSEKLQELKRCYSEMDEPSGV